MAHVDEYDVVVIGAGAVGENVADRAVQGGLTAVLIDSELVGGECSYWACMPSKALIRSGLALRAAQRLEGAREAVTGELDVQAVLARRTRITHDWDDSSQVKWVESAGIALIRGHARITAEKELTVTAADGTSRTVRARHAVVVSTGSDPLLPDIPGLLDANPWTPRDATSARTAPDSLAIIGGGVVAVEMATAYASFGTTVTIFARSGLLTNQEDFAGELVGEGLRDLGVDVRRASPTRVERTDAGIVIHSDGDTVTATEVLVATGRVPRTTDLGLETVGLTPGDWITVDDTMRVPGIDWLYATGDVNHRALLTHQGKYQARAAGDVIAARAKGEPVDDAPWGRHVATADHSAVPQVTFSDPEVASVGITSAEAAKQGLDVRVVDYDISWVAGATIQADHYRGKARMIVDEKRRVILGVTFVGQDVSELLQSATFAIVGEIPIERLWHGVPAYPTLSEIWLRLLETYGRDS
ncbi:dihydrolipoamide dehydrogenase [Leifsonia sp. AK011]|uniref:dihydrolipoyl dehydrogenase family protein n=1 Tax=Leifsonia sp. AK011 TaxID=2723075 RepID=UPI0015C6E5D6|nr:NAD(P)/FAD-dependent oxidoreductase [Leifsonia sp. AK011]NYF10321.1 dihydrolipoamide dehydrogenase [Leifsonia sp. AK011]